MAKRDLQVQTPGETPAANQAPSEDNAQPPVERADYARMRADDIDPAALTAPVLSADGWVVPTPKA